MFDDEQAHKRKAHGMNRGGQRVLCLLITEASTKILLQAGCRQRKHINKLGGGSRARRLQTNMSNYMVIYNEGETEGRESYPERAGAGEGLKNEN